MIKNIEKKINVTLKVYVHDKKKKKKPLMTNFYYYIYI